MNNKNKLMYVFCFFVLHQVIFKPVEINATDLKIKAKENHQTMVGFGAAIAWGGDQLAAHPKKDEIYNYIFKDLGLDILRLRNAFRYGKPEDSLYTPKNVSAMIALSEEKPRILISSWSPEAGLKSNLSRENGGTLRGI